MVKLLRVGVQIKLSVCGMLPQVLILFTLNGHTDLIDGVAFSPDGKTLASCSRDGTIRLWNPATGTHKRTLTGTLFGDYGHTFSVYSVVFSPDGRIIAGGQNSFISLWDAHTGTHQQILAGHRAPAFNLSFSPDGTILASGSQDGTVLLWDISSFALVPFAEDVNADGVVNIQDLVLVASNLGETGENPADVNGDGVVNIQDLVQVAGQLGKRCGISVYMGQ